MPGMTQQQIAEATGVSQSAVYLVEKRALRKLGERLLADAEAEGMSLNEYLFGYAGESGFARGFLRAVNLEMGE